MRPTFCGIDLSHADCRRTKEEERPTRSEFCLGDPNGPLDITSAFGMEDRTARDGRERRGWPEWLLAR